MPILEMVGFNGLAKERSSFKSNKGKKKIVKSKLVIKVELF